MCAAPALTLSIPPVRFVPLPTAGTSASASTDDPVRVPMQTGLATGRRWDMWPYVCVAVVVIVGVVVIYSVSIGERAAVRRVYGFRDG